MSFPRILHESWTNQSTHKVSRHEGHHLQGDTSHSTDVTPETITLSIIAPHYREASHISTCVYYTRVFFQHFVSLGRRRGGCEGVVWGLGAALRWSVSRRDNVVGVMPI